MFSSTGTFVRRKYAIRIDLAFEAGQERRCRCLCIGAALSMEGVGGYSGAESALLRSKRKRHRENPFLGLPAGGRVSGSVAPKRRRSARVSRPWEFSTPVR